MSRRFINLGILHTCIVILLLLYLPRSLHKYQGNMASPAANVGPQNERDHVHRFSPLPQSEPDNEIENKALSISVEQESARPRPTTVDCSNRIFNVSAQNCDMIQDVLGLTVLLMLLFLPLYQRMLTPTENPVPPVFTLNSMYISNFSTASGELAATWDAKLTVVNRNVSSIYFRKIDFTIFYKQNPEDVLSVASNAYSFYLDEGEAAKLHLKFTSTGWEDDQPFVESRLVEEMGKDRVKDGALSFGMQMKVAATYYGDAWVSDVDMSPHCEGLTVEFVPNKGSGRLANPNRNFSVPIRWKPFSFF